MNGSGSGIIVLVNEIAHKISFQTMHNMSFLTPMVSEKQN